MPPTSTEPAAAADLAHRPRRPSAIDLGLGAGLALVAVLSGLFAEPDQPGAAQPTSWWQWALLAVPSAMVAIRRWNPVAVAVAATVAQAAIWVGDLPEFLLALVVLFFTAASDGGRWGVRVAGGCAAVLTVVTAVGVRVAEDVAVYQVPLVALTFGAAIALGVGAARQRELAVELSTAVTTARLEGEHRRHQAVIEERTTIAKELHDIIGHALATIAVRAEAADRVAAKQPQAATEAIASIAVAARVSLDETRRVLAGLRSSGPNGRADLSPPPDLDAIRELVAELGRAGADVTLSESGCDQQRPPAVVLGGAYRIVQESLTNAVKHGGPGVSVSVVLRCEGDHLDIGVSNPQPIGGDRGGGPPASAGSGIDGMAERAHVLGGTFRASIQSSPDGDRFVVQARLPTRPLGASPDEPGEPHSQRGPDQEDPT